MESKIIPFPTVDPIAAGNDPVLERALFFAEYDMIEMTMTIPKAEVNHEAKAVY